MLLPAHRIGPRIHRLDQLIVQAINRGFEAMDLTSTQSHILRYLSENEDKVIYPRDIEKRFGLTHPTVSGVLQRLEAKQYVVCSPDPDDRRYKRVALTERARRQQQSICLFFSELEQSLVRGMTPDEVQTFIRLLELASENLTQSLHKEESNV